MTRQTALDIECVPTTEKPHFDQPESWEVFACSLSFRPAADADPETRVFVRRDGSDSARRKLLCAMGNQLAAWQPIDVLLTFNGGDPETGEGFDLPVLAHHIERIEDPDLAAHIESALDVPHRDLFAELVDAQPDDEKWPSLAEALEERSITNPEAELRKRALTGADMPAFGARVLAEDDDLAAIERDALVTYAESDVTPLHQLCDSLDDGREERIRAEAATVTEHGESVSSGRVEGER